MNAVTLTVCNSEEAEKAGYTRDDIHWWTTMVLCWLQSLGAIKVNEERVSRSAGREGYYDRFAPFVIVTAQFDGEIPEDPTLCDMILQQENKLGGSLVLEKMDPVTTRPMIAAYKRAVEEYQKKLGEIGGLAGQIIKGTGAPPSAM